MKISVIGCGRWGSFIAWYLNRTGHEVMLYGRQDSSRMKQFQQTRENGIIRLDNEIELVTDMKQALLSEVIVISIPSQGLRALAAEINQLAPENKTFVLCMKGLEAETGKRLTEIVEETLLIPHETAVWLGPGHVQEFYAGTPNCMVIDSKSEAVKAKLVDSFSSDLIRFYYGQDLIGNEIGAAAKNVIGIAAGMLDGLGLSSLKGALMSRGTREIARLIKAMGGNELSAYGLCHLGDYEATVFSKFSHNRMFGEKFVKGEPYTQLAEGAFAVKGILLLAEKSYCALPICSAVYDVVYEKQEAKTIINKLFSRSIKNEF
ncbi:NAD(P)H-dependent glycerol-3-phosphate dehydrogenase [Scatolibacter rhodanostii]|uniref:NAD(P)H-dependent glycerol-3-phosphate dehydrogenase n=1 Tax=Scatolibacter rhodanostii TaxID=2014781 RepID=UPI000C074A5E|nr:NAD(P)H-dependent glycerol-3-phosphate dehydrogenase [Scatolibacter rhodanostii]